MNMALIVISSIIYYNRFMTVTIEVINKGAMNLLNDMESMGLIHVKPSVPQNSEEIVRNEKYSSFLKLRGIHRNIPGASVDEFLASCREDKENELAIEKSQEERRFRIASTKLPS